LNNAPGHPPNTGTVTVDVKVEYLPQNTCVCTILEDLKYLRLPEISAIAQELRLNKIEPDDVPVTGKPFSVSYKCASRIFGAQLIQKQQQQEQEDPILRSIETHDLGEILARIDRHLPR
jgi:hypothetical protein